MIPIVEITLGSLLRVALEGIAGNPTSAPPKAAQLDLLDGIFEDLPAEELADCKKFFGQRRVKIVHMFPREQVDGPMYVISGPTERESRFFLGGYMGGGVTIDEDTGEASEDIGAIWDSTIRIGCWSTNSAQETIYLYHLAKHLLTANRELIEEAGLMNAQFSGTDWEPKPEYYPTFVYLRTLELRGQVEARASVTYGLIKGLKATATFEDASNPDPYTVTVQVGEVPEE